MARRLSDGVGAHGALATKSRKEFLSLFLAALRRGRGAADLKALRPSGAVKFAADLSMAMTAAGTTWSRSVISQSRKVCPAVVDFIRSCKAKSCNGFSRGDAKRGVSRSNLLRMRKNLYSTGRKRSKARGVRRLNGLCKRSMRRMVRALLRTEEKRHVSKPEIGHMTARVEVLKSLVPGGAAMDTPLLLEEAFHYIEALHMQVESMRALLHYSEDRRNSSN